MHVHLSHFFSSSVKYCELSERIYLFVVSYLGGSQAQQQLPSTYSYDPSSGFYYDSATGLYYDLKTQVHNCYVTFNVCIYM